MKRLLAIFALTFAACGGGDPAEPDPTEALVACDECAEAIVSSGEFPELTLMSDAETKRLTIDCDAAGHPRSVGLVEICDVVTLSDVIQSMLTDCRPGVTELPPPCSPSE